MYVAVLTAATVTVIALKRMVNRKTVNVLMESLVKPVQTNRQRHQRKKPLSSKSL